MYRNYENQNDLEILLEEKSADLQKAMDENLDDEIILSLFEDVSELKARVNFAMQDADFDRYY